MKKNKNIFSAPSCVLILFFTSSVFSWAQVSAPPGQRPRFFTIDKGQVKAATLPSQQTPVVDELPLARAPYELLSPGWKIQEIARTGDRMDDEFARPGQPAGLAVFAGPRAGTLTLISAHLAPVTGLQDAVASHRISADFMYGGQGSLTRTVIDEATGKVLRQELAIVGSRLSTAGTATPWGTFLCGEELDALGKAGGWVYEVAPHVKGISPVIPWQLPGRLSVGAVCVDPLAQVIYIGEARVGGLLYRYKPVLWGDLSKGGRLQVLGVEQSHNGFADSQLPLTAGSPVRCFWIDLGDAQTENLRAQAVSLGAAKIGNLSGMALRDGQLILTDGRLLSVSAQMLGLYPLKKTGEEPLNPVRVGFWGQRMLVAEGRDEGARLMIEENGGVWRPILWVKQGGIGGWAVSADGQTIFVNLAHEGLLLALKRIL